MHRKYQTLPELIRCTVRDFGLREALGEKQRDGSWKWLPYRDFGDLVEDTRAGLKHLGVGRGDRVVLLFENRIEWAVFAFACFGIGAVCVPLAKEQRYPEWMQVVRDCSVKAVVTADPRVEATLRSSSGSFPYPVNTIVLDRPEDDPNGYASLLRTGRRHPLPASRVEPQDVALLLHTSGTSSRPKPVLLTHGNICSAVDAAAQRFGFTEKEMSLAILPWSDSFAQVVELYVLVAQGATVAISNDPLALREQLLEVRPTVLYAPPQVLAGVHQDILRLVQKAPSPVQSVFRSGMAAGAKRQHTARLSIAERGALSVTDRLLFSSVRQSWGSRLRCFVNGGSPLAAEVGAGLCSLGVDVWDHYGLAEASAVVSSHLVGGKTSHSLGKPFPGTRIRIDSTGSAKLGPRPLGLLNLGEVVVSGPQVMDPHSEFGSEGFSEEGAVGTGDWGYLDGDGLLHVLGTISETYQLSDGTLVWPSALEQRLRLSPFVAELLIFGDGKPYNVALVVPNLAALQLRAQAQGWKVMDVSTDRRVQSLLRSELEQRGRDLEPQYRPQKFLIASEPFSRQAGQLANSMKVRREVVIGEYRAQLEALYASDHGAPSL